MRIACMGVALLATAGQARAATAPVREPDRGVRFHAEDLERPLMVLRAGTLLIEECNGRLRSKCTPAQRESASARPSTGERLDLLTLFPQRIAVDAAKRVANYEEMRARLAQIGGTLLADMDRYDRKLFARYGATLSVCPTPDAQGFRDELAILQSLDLQKFSRLAPGEYSKVRDEIAHEEAALADGIRADWSPLDCKAALELGEALLQLMYIKLEPWMENPDLVATPDELRGRDTQFLILAAFELETRVNPEVSSKLRELNRKYGADTRD